VLQEKAEMVQVRATSLKKKAKKMNAPWWSRWFGGLCAGGGGPCGGPEQSRGATVDVGTALKVQRKTQQLRRATMD